jgi:hypothetical protein
MKTELNYRLISKLKPSDKEYEVRDTKMNGLVLRVHPSGRMVYTLIHARGNRHLGQPTKSIITKHGKEQRM